MRDTLTRIRKDPTLASEAFYTAPQYLLRTGRVSEELRERYQHHRDGGAFLPRGLEQLLPLQGLLQAIKTDEGIETQYARSLRDAEELERYFRHSTGGSTS